MKRSFILPLFFLLALGVQAQDTLSYDHPITPPDLTRIRLKEAPGETLEFIGRIGSDFDTALDSLRKLKNIPSEIIKEPIEVLFDYDDRLFFGISYGDCAMYSDVLDTKGYYYLRSWYCSDDNYHPFLENGKVWRTGIDSSDGFSEQYEYCLYGDTVLDGKTCCVLGVSKLKPIGGAYTPIDTLYVGAMYEEGHKVYGAKQGESHLALLYDFESPEGTDLKINGDLYTITCRVKSTDDAYKGNYTYIKVKGDTEEIVTYWMEGVGGFHSPMESVFDSSQTGLRNEILISCSLGDEVIYLREDCIPNKLYVKKQWLDFTHVTKPRPKAPAKGAGQSHISLLTSSKETTGANGGEGETLSGDYSDTRLFVNLNPLSGLYFITMLDEAGQKVYHKEVLTSNVVALNSDLRNYKEGLYTLTIENSEEQYTAYLTLPLPLDDDAVSSPQMINDKWSNGRFFDLTGRRLNTPPAKGIYIEDGRVRVAQ
ncbi:MAG: hypothetical protein J6W75_01060 [Bacteroidaceae bacterium]|nr:hypothetical protein [Bacteroidaceae bacterium]